MPRLDRWRCMTARRRLHERLRRSSSVDRRDQDLPRRLSSARGRRPSTPCATSRFRLEGGTALGARRRVRLGQDHMRPRDRRASTASTSGRILFRGATSPKSAARRRARLCRAPCRWSSRIRSRPSTPPTRSATISSGPLKLHGTPRAVMPPSAVRRESSPRSSSIPDETIGKYPARALGRRAPARQPRPRAGCRRRADHRRRADLDARRVDPPVASST